MRKIVMSALVVGLTGCATPGSYGNYAAASLDANKTMADATVAQLVVLYPPAHTSLNLKQPTTDAYGAALVTGLRDKGYSLMEFQPQAQPTSSVSAPATASVPATTATASGIDLSYVVDAPAPQSMSLYRVTVQVGAQSISRAFVVATNGKLYPAGAWVHKE